MHNFATGKFTFVPFYQANQNKWEDEIHPPFLFVW